MAVIAGHPVLLQLAHAVHRGQLGRAVRQQLGKQALGGQLGLGQRVRVGAVGGQLIALADQLPAHAVQRFALFAGHAAFMAVRQPVRFHRAADLVQINAGIALLAHSADIALE